MSENRRFEFKSALAVAALTVLLLGASRCATRVGIVDRSANAAEMNDATVIIQGCGNQPAVGYTYCRKTEGQTTGDEFFYLLAPPSDCKDEKTCVFFKIFFPDGSPALGLAVPRLETSVKVPWSELTKKPAFEKADRGFWGVTMEWKFVDPEGNERSAYAEGEIRLRVLGRGYTALHEIAEDESFAWKWGGDSHLFRMTTSGRAFVGKSAGILK